MVKKCWLNIVPCELDGVNWIAPTVQSLRHLKMFKYEASVCVCVKSLVQRAHPELGEPTAWATEMHQVPESRMFTNVPMRRAIFLNVD